MVRGGPDFGAVAARALTSPVLDPGELAVRLGAGSVFDRRGFVIASLAGGRLFEFHTSNSNGGRTDLAPVNGLTESYSLRMFTTTSADVAKVIYRMGYPGESGVAVEAVLTPELGSDADLIVAVQATDSAGGDASGAIKWDVGTSDWQFFDATNSFVDTPTQPPDPPNTMFTSIKVAVDPATGEYLYAVVNGIDFGLRGTACSTAGGTSGTMLATVQLQSEGAGDDIVWLANVIVTVNEE